eukprot:4663872-Prymnesium_polylepis.1
MVALAAIGQCDRQLLQRNGDAHLFGALLVGVAEPPLAVVNLKPPLRPPPRRPLVLLRQPAPHPLIGALR